jgi:hypothetical protein
VCCGAVAALEACSHGSLSELPKYQGSKDCKRAVEAIDACVQAHHDLAEMAEKAASKQAAAETA